MYENLTVEQFMPLRCAQLREAMGVSARRMSLDLDQSSSYIGQFENGIFLPRMEKFIEICNYLNVTPSDYFEPLNNYPQLIKELVDILIKVDDPKLIESLLTLAKGYSE